jgi:peptidoglycan/xylan/chitin deacetylase (PgdA/CDA1 family)
VLGTITHFVVTEPLAGLTFDDGPHPDYTPRLLDLLRRHGAQATFFMVGESAARYPEIVRRVAEEGHAIGNHSWDHPAYPMLSRRERWTQILACEHALAPYGQKLLRPPRLEQDLASRVDALLLGYDVVAYNVHADDWWQPDAAAMAERIEKGLRPGCVVLLHDALFSGEHDRFRPRVEHERLPDRGPMLDALARVLSHAGSRLRFVTIPQLLRRGRPQRQNWYRRWARDPDTLHRLNGGR